jgi:hypothetical protein
MRVSHPDGTEHICFLGNFFIEITPEGVDDPLRHGTVIYRMRVCTKGGSGYEHIQYADCYQLRELRDAIDQLLAR